MLSRSRFLQSLAATLVVLIAAFVLVCTPTPLFATDLTKIDRTIAKEPAYKSKPRYCLLVFGPEAKHRVWLVLDGKLLYVDRNGNGDLTEAGECVTPEKNADRPDLVLFKLAELRVGPRLHRDLYLHVSKLDAFADSEKRAKAILGKDPSAQAYFLGMSLDVPGWKGSGVGGRVQHTVSLSDSNGILQFADRPQDAPIIHFDGPREITLDTTELRIGREIDFIVGVGTRGLGAGTHTSIEYDGVIPERAHPTLEIAYPPKTPGEPPTRVKYELKERC